MDDWDDLVEPARSALEALLRKGDDMADRIEELEAKLAEVEAERDQADKLIAATFADAASNNIRLAEASHRAKAAEAKLAEVEAERDHWETVAIARQARGIVIAQKLDAAEARIAHLENHIEGVAKDTHKIMVAYEAALVAANMFGMEAGAKLAGLV